MSVTVDEVRIYDRALSQEDVSELYDLEKPEEVDWTESTFEIVEGLSDWMTWEEARADAESRGGRLAVLNTQEKIDRVTAYLNARGSWPFMWIGLTDRENEGEWRWITGEALGASNWRSGEPNGTGGGVDSDFVHILDSSHPGGARGRWNDAPAAPGNPANLPVSLVYLLEIPASTLNDGLVAYYPFNGNADDESGNGHDGTVNGATLTSDRGGRSNSAYSFDGTNDFITVDSSPELRALSSLSVSTWIQVGSSQSPAPNNNHAILASWAGGGDGRAFWLGTTGNFSPPGSRIGVGTGPGNPHGDLFNPSDTTITDGAWHHVVYAHDLNGAALYIDGISIVESEVGFPIREFVEPLVFGADNNGVRANFRGFIDDTRIYNRGLSADEVAALYELERPASTLSDGLVAYYPFNGNANDESGNGHDGTINGASLTTDRNGEAGSAYSFDGTNDFIEVSHSSELNFERTLCIAFWMKPDSWGGRSEEVGGIVSKMPNDNTEPYEHGYAVFHDFNRNGKMAFRYNGEGLNQQDFPRAISESNASVGEWEHWAVIYDRDSVSWYRNGALDKRHDNQPSVIRMVTDVPLHIGHAQHWDGWGFKTYYDGAIDDVRIYNRALSDAEVSALYELESTTPEHTPPGLEIDAYLESDPGEPLTVDATPISGYPADFTYQWYLDGVAVPAAFGGTGSSVTFAGVLT
ncbi:MAG TPA: LamG-like jellyroll fold domain-containing protein, partial [Roseibacillus sp.]|nr:LamG-like jellyroll fold domain-containing protein [Roseibacillus sp.]